MTNPNHIPQAIELTPVERSLFGVNKVREWRAQQTESLVDLIRVNNYDAQAFSDAFNANIQNSLDAFLMDNGIDQQSPNYAEIRQIYLDARIGSGNGNGVSEDEWGNSPASRGLNPQDTESYSVKLEKRLSDRLSQNPQDSLDSHDDHRQALESEYESYADLLTARHEWSTISAKRQGRAFSKKDKKLEDAREDYNSKVQKFGIEQLSSSVDDTDDELTVNAKIIEYLFEEQKKLRELTTEKLQGTKVGKFVAFMNRGSRKTRFFKAVGLGVGAGLAGTFVAGAAGAAGVSVAAVAASRFVRGYTKGDQHRGMETAEEAFDANSPFYPDTVEATEFTKKFEEITKDYDKIFEEDTKKEQKKRRRALGYGALMVAAGSTAGYAAHYVSGIDYQWKHPFGGTDSRPSGSSALGSAKLGLPDDLNSGSGIDTPSGYNHYDFSSDAHSVIPGEGWYQTFQDMNIPSSERAELLAKIGPDLQEKGWAYKMPNGEWGISRSGQLPNNVLQLIQDSRK